MNRTLLISLSLLAAALVPASAETLDYLDYWAHLSDIEATDYSYDCGGVVDVAVKGNMAYFCDATGLQVVDFTEPSNAYKRGYVSISPAIRRCEVKDHFVYVLATSGQINIVDVDDHDAPIIYNTEPAGSIARDLVVAGNYLYVVTQSAELRTYSLDLAHVPTVVNTLQLPLDHAVRVGLQGDRLVVAGDGGLAVVNIAVPDWPSVLGTAVLPGDVLDLSVRGDLAAVGNWSDVRLYDVSDPAAITELSVIDESALSVLLTSNQQLWYGWEDCWYYGAMHICDVQDPTAPVLLHEAIRDFRGGPTAMVEFQGLVFASEHMCWCAGEWPAYHVFQLGEAPPPPPLDEVDAGAHSGAVMHGNRLEAGTVDGGGVRRFDLSDPGGIQELAPFDDGYSYFLLDEDDGVIGSMRALETFQFWFQVLVREADGSLRRGGDLTLDAYPSFLAYSDGLALLGYKEYQGGGVLAIDVTDPENPVLLGDLFPGANVLALELEGSLAILRAGSQTNLWDLSEPLSPVQVGILDAGYNWARTAFRVVHRDGVPLLFNGYNATNSYYVGGYLEVWNLADPGQPERVLQLRQLACGEVADAQLRDDLLAVATSNQFTMYRWPALEAPAEYVGRVRLPQETSMYRPVKVEVVDGALVTLHQDGTLATRALPVGTITPVPDGPPAPADLVLQVTPNPFNPTCRVWLDVPTAAETVLEIFDTRGRRVRRLHAGALAAGRHGLAFDGKDDHGRALASGIYLARVRAGGRTASTKLTLTR